VVWPFAVRFDSFARTKTTRGRRENKDSARRNMGAADQIVDSNSSTNNNSNNDGEFDHDFKRVSEVLESSKACMFQPNLFSR